jgi:Protein kinase domain
MGRIAIRLGLGVALVAAGALVGAQAFHAASERQSQAAEARRQAAADDEARRLAAEQEAMHTQVLRAANARALNAAIEDHVDGPTLVDLFDNEEWWRTYREEFPITRVILGDALLATRGKLDLGGRDGELVKAARKQRVATARMVVGGQMMVVGAALLPALPDREPVLVLAKPAAPPPPAPAHTGAPSSTIRVGEHPVPWVAAALMVLIGLALVISGRRGASAPATAAPGEIPKEPTLRFGTPARPQPMGPPAAPGSTAARPPMATGGAMTIPRAVGPTGVAPAVAPAPAPVPAPARTRAPTPPPLGASGPNSFGRYKLLDRLGEGGMSEIFTAETSGVEGFSRTFVLKRLRPELRHDKEAVAQFIDEARNQASLVHSNIVPVFDFGMVGNEYFITQEYIAGRDLVRLVGRVEEATGQRGLDPRVALYIAYETLQALSYAHDRRDKTGAPMGIVHRDVSAGNIIVSLQGEVKLSDFGIVKSNRRVTKTQVGMVKGNANFMSPEQARGLPVDARSDLFSLAQVLYYLLTGELLYNGQNDLDVLYKAATGPTYDDFQRMHTLADPAGQILEKALAFDPRERFQSAAEFADAVAAHVGGGKAEAARLMQELFGEELSHEAA